MHKTMLLSVCVVMALFISVSVADTHSGSSRSISQIEPERIRLPAYVDNLGGYIDGTGKMVIAPQFEGVFEFSEHRAPVLLGMQITCESAISQFVFIDPQGMIVIDGPFERVGLFKEGLATVRSHKHGKWGFINATGEHVIDYLFDSSFGFSEGRAAVEVDGKWGLIDKTGRAILNPRYEVVKPFREGMAVYKSNNLLGYLDRDGNVVISASYIRADDFSEGLAFVSTETEAGYINKSGNYEIVVQPRSFSSCGPFQNGLAALNSAAGNAYYINRQGETSLEPDIEFAGNFSEGLAAVKKGGKWGYIDVTGLMVIPPMWEKAGNFQNGFAEVKGGQFTGYINSQGRYIWKAPRNEP